MCRMFVVHANAPTRATGSLLTAPHSLTTQSCADVEEGLCHQDGWGVGYFVDGQPRRVRSTRAASGDPRYNEAAQTLAATTLLGHVRRASAGSVAERNCHPFVCGRWLFAHNGTLQEFDARKARLLAAIPEHLRHGIEGDTDSEHAFRFILGRLERAAGSLEGHMDAGLAAREMAAAIRQLVELFPDSTEPTKCNFLLTDGRILLVSRWGNTLSWLERSRPEPPIDDGPVDQRATYHAIVLASEPTSPEAWKEVPDRALMVVDADLKYTIWPIVD